MEAYHGEPKRGPRGILSSGMGGAQQSSQDVHFMIIHRANSSALRMCSEDRDVIREVHDLQGVRAGPPDSTGLARSLRAD